MNTGTEAVGSGSFVLRFVFLGCILIYSPMIVFASMVSRSEDPGTSPAAEPFVLTASGSDDAVTSPAAEPGGSEISLNEFVITGPVEMQAGPITLTITNEGVTAHNLAVRDLGITTPDIAAGDSAELDLGSLSPGSYEFYCSIPGHQQAGMVLTFTVTEPA